MSATTNRASQCAIYRYPPDNNIFWSIFIRQLFELVFHRQRFGVIMTNTGLYLHFVFRKPKLCGCILSKEGIDCNNVIQTP